MNVFRRTLAWAKTIVSPAAALAEIVSSIGPESEHVAPMSHATMSLRPEGNLRTIELPPDVVRDVLGASRSSQRDSIAPWPAVDRYPIVIGQSITFQQLAAAYRLALTGYRQRFVDFLCELLENDPHCFAVLSQRILTVAGARIEWKPAVPPDHPRYEEAKEVADFVQCVVGAIPCLRQQLASLLWALFFAVAAAEIHWCRRDGEWWVEKLSWIHSRRLAYPDPDRWELHVWDQGNVGPGDFGSYPTSRLFGVVVSEYPGKFIVHAPQLRADYPTRDGLGRELGNWMLLKRLAARAASQYLDRFARPIGNGTYKTANDDKKRLAEDKDIKSLEGAMIALGLGTLSSFTHPDSVDVNVLNPDGSSSAKLTFSEFLAYADAQMSKGVLGQTYTTEPGAFGAKGTAEVGRKGAIDIARFDAANLADTLRRDLGTPIVKLNRPDSVDLIPICEIHVEDEPSPDAVMNLAVKGVGIFMDLDQEDLARRTGLTLANRDAGDPKAKQPPRLVPVKPVEVGMGTINPALAPEPDDDHEAPGDGADHPNSGGNADPEDDEPAAPDSEELEDETPATPPN